jgi:branched-chain amino acid transport system permease protein
MIFEQLMGNLVQGLVLGAVYGMATMGLSLIFGVLKVVNVGHGAFVMVGAFITLFFFNTLGLNPIFAIPAAFLVGVAIGLLFYYAAISKLLHAPELATLLATFSVGVLLEETIKLIFGSEFRGYHWDIGRIDLGFTALPMGKIYACIGSAAIALLLYVWFKRTRAGSAMRSVVEDSEGARVCGASMQ